MGVRERPDRITELAKLPTGPKRLAKAAETSGWTWDATAASAILDDQLIDSIVVRCMRKDFRVSARWEDIDGGGLKLATVQKLQSGKFPVVINLTQGITVITENPVVDSVKHVKQRPEEAQ
jgi:hypothetical protein